jgi:hypothetical protein
MKKTHPIWKIGLFAKLNKDYAKCLECNSVLKLSNRSITSLITHLHSFKHKDSDYLKNYYQLQNQKASQGTNKSRHYIHAKKIPGCQYAKVFL